MPRFLYKAEHLDFLREGYQSMLVPELTRAFNLRFGLEKENTEIKSTLKNYRITCGRKVGAILWRSKAYTPEQGQWLRDNYPLMQLKQLVEAFNTAFNSVKTASQIKAFIKNNKITSGRSGRFVAGQAAWNHGVKGHMGPNVTSFKKGQIPHTKKRLWSERINRDGYVEISIPEPNPWTGAPTRYKHKHLWLWEVEHGPLPKGHVVIFRDGNNRNFANDNLMLVTRAELLCLNMHDYKTAPDELKPAILALARVEAKAGIRTICGHNKRALKLGGVTRGTNI